MPTTEAGQRRLEFQRQRVLRLDRIIARLRPGTRNHRRATRIRNREYRRLQGMRKRMGPSRGGMIIVMAVATPKMRRGMSSRRSKPRMRSKRY